MQDQQNRQDAAESPEPQVLTLELRGYLMLLLFIHSIPRLVNLIGTMNLSRVVALTHARNSGSLAHSLVNNLYLLSISSRPADLVDDFYSTFVAHPLDSSKIAVDDTCIELEKARHVFIDGSFFPATCFEFATAWLANPLDYDNADAMNAFVEDVLTKLQERVPGQHVSQDTDSEGQEDESTEEVLGDS